MKANDKVLYLGQPGTILCELPEGTCLVEVDGWEDEEGYSEGIRVIASRHDVAPIGTNPFAKYHEKGRALREQLCDLRAQIREAVKLRDDARAGIQARAGERVALQRVLDYLDGKLTWALELGYRMQIVRVEDLRCQCNPRDLKLISLFGDSNGDLNFRVGHYSDGSGMGSHEIELFPSKEDAIQRAREAVDEVLADDIKRLCADALIEEYGFDSALIREHKKFVAERKAEEGRARIALLQKEIDQLKAEATNA